MRPILIIIMVCGFATAPAQDRESAFRSKMVTNQFFGGAGGDSMYVHEKYTNIVTAIITNWGPDTVDVAKNNDTTATQLVYGQLPPGISFPWTGYANWFRVRARNDSARVDIAIPVRN